LNVLARIAGAIVGVALFILALLFASVLLAVAGGVALGVWAWLLWKTRKLRKEAEKRGGAVVEGEYRVEREVQQLDDDVR